jgi:hypothetical protein
MDQMAIDLESSQFPANTPSSLGTRQVCTRINENNLIDADEDIVDGMIIDITAMGIPPFDDGGTPGDPTDDSGGITGFSYTLDYESQYNLTVSALDNNGLLYRDDPPPMGTGSDSTPDDNADFVWHGSDLDTVDSNPEDGSGWLHRLTLISEPVAGAGTHSLTLASPAHIDAAGTSHAPDAAFGALISVNSAACGLHDGDFDGIGAVFDNCPFVFNPGQENSDTDPFGDACDNCPTLSNNQANYDGQYGDTLGDACDSEDDGDAFSDADEALITTNPLDNCGEPVQYPGRNYLTSSSWPADLRSEGASANRVDISDLATYIVAPRAYNSSPGDPGYHPRWNVRPGGGFGHEINIQDLAVFPLTTPLMLGAVRAYNGPACTP